MSEVSPQQSCEYIALTAAKQCTRSVLVQSICIVPVQGTLLIVNRTYGTHKNLDIHVFFPTIFGPIYYGPP